MRHVRLILSVGTQEPRIRAADGAFLLLKDPSDPRVRRLVEERGSRAKGLYAAAKAVFDHLDDRPAELRFPILDQAIGFVLSREAAVDELILIATNSTDRARAEEGPHRDDTFWTAQLAETVFVHQIARVKSCRILQLKDAQPQLYRVAKSLLRKSDLLEGLPEGSHLYVCTSPGLPAVNQAVVFSTLHEHSGQTFPFQVVEPGRDVLERGESGDGAETVAEADVLGDFIARQMRMLIGRYDYAMARSFLSTAPEKPEIGKTNLEELLTRADNFSKVRINESVYAGRWDSYFVRVYAALRVTEAQFVLEEWDEGMVWMADCATFCQDLLLAVSEGKELFVVRRAEDAERKEATSNLNGELRTVWDCIKPFRNKCAEWRNVYTHRLLAKDTVSAKAWFAAQPWHTPQGLCQRMEALIDMAASACGILDLGALKHTVRPFAEINREIEREIAAYFPEDE